MPFSLVLNSCAVPSSGDMPDLAFPYLPGILIIPTSYASIVSPMTVLYALCLFPLHLPYLFPMEEEAYVFLFIDDVCVCDDDDLLCGNSLFLLHSM